MNGKNVATSRHFLLNGKIALHQANGRAHRAGLDAVMLAASVLADEKSELRLVDLGAGVGSASLCVLHRLHKASAVLVENESHTLHLARLTLADAHNQWLKGRARLLSADVTLRGAQRTALGLEPNMADYVIMNPPYYQAHKVRQSPDENRRAAHILSAEGLDAWFRTAAAVLVPEGRISIIFPTSGLPDLLRCMDGRFGDICVFPLYRGVGEEAIRLVVVARKASRAPLRFLAGLALHQPPETGQTRREWTPEALAVLNGKAALVI